MRRHTSNPGGWLLLAVLCLASPLQAQVKLFGDDLNLTSASGSVGTGYTGSYGNVVVSSHNLGWNAAGALNGFYYNPNFLSFSVQPFYDQSRANSDSQSITSSSGISFTSNIFGGSHFPGSFTYTKNYNSSGTFGIPGLPDFTTHGNNDSLGIGWSALVPDWPTLSAQFQLSHSAYSLYGTNDDGRAEAISLNLHSNYRVAGFNLNGGYSHSLNDSEVPLVLTGGGTTTANGSSDTLTFGASHILPMHGNFMATFSRFSSDYAYSTGLTSGNNANDSFTATASITPVPKVTVSGSMSYDDNLGGSVVQQILQEGGLVQQPLEIPGSHSLSLTGTTSYQPRSDLSLSGQFQRRQQTWAGMDLGMNTYTGLVRFTHAVWGGNLALNSTVGASQQDNEPGMLLGLSESVSYSRRFGAWDTAVGFGYAQNVQSILITYMTSNYTFGGTVRRKIGPLYWSAAANGGRTGITVQEGSGASNESFSMSLSTGRHFAGSASYQESRGQALQTLAGLGPNPFPIPLVEPLLILYSGKSYAFSASSTPIRRLALTASYSRSLSDTIGGVANSNNQFSQFTFSTHYQWRKMYWTAGYSRFKQDISIAGIPPSQLSTFYVGVYRWFNFF